MKGKVRRDASMSSFGSVMSLAGKNHFRSIRRYGMMKHFDPHERGLFQDDDVLSQQDAKWFDMKMMSIFQIKK